MLNDLQFASCKLQQNAAVEDAKEIFGENQPYVVERRFGEKTVIFNDHFIRTSREAMTTGCMAKMNDQELLLFDRWVAYENGSSFRDITRTDDYIVVALDQWFMDDLLGNAHPILNSCFDSDAHRWEDTVEWQDL